MDETHALAAFPAAVSVSAADVRSRVAASGRVLIVLDDDPTGTQSVADLPVLTSWAEADFDWAFGRAAAAIYVLTNTRSLSRADAADRNRQIVRNAGAAAARHGLVLGFVSRGDSTLRGHYPLETDVIAETLTQLTGEVIDGVVIVPAFPDAGRVTIAGVHYMRGENGLTPVAETEFARDSTFGYTHSDLPGYVEEKTAGRVSAADVVVLDLGIIRAGATVIADALDGVTGATPIVVDAVTEDDLRLLALGLDAAEARGKSLLYRVGPPFVRARIGQDKRDPLTIDEIFPVGAANTGGGLIVVGSHVGVTTRQLAALGAARPWTATIEIDVAKVVGTDPARSDAYLTGIVAEIVERLRAGDVVVHTSRVLVKSDDPEASLHISRQVSAAVVTLVQRTLAAHPPRFVIAKGGITSSDVATRGLGIRHAIVRGPMLPGLVSLWEPTDGPAAGIPYVVFAGNVGDDQSLADVVAVLSADRTHPAASTAPTLTDTRTTAPSGAHS